MTGRPALLLALTVALAPALGSTPVAGAEVDIELLVERALPLAPGDVAEAAPPTFVLLQSGQFYMGGSSEILEGRLTGQAHKALRERIARVRKLKGLGATVELGPGPERCRLVFGKGPEILATGDPEQAPFALRPLSALIDVVSHFDDPSLQLFHPEQYRLLVRQGTLPGGCRPWTLSVSLIDALPAPRVLPAAAAAGWPTGVHPASVCAGDKTYVVALRPLLPWESQAR
jgi:hypothetical protein